MPPIKTNRTRTYPYSASWSLDIGTFNAAGGGSIYEFGFQANTQVGIPQTGMLSLMSWGITISPPSGTGPYTARTQCTIGSLGATSTSAGSTTTGGTINGSASISVDMEEISTYALTSPGNPRTEYWIIQDRPKVGGSITASLTWNGETVTISTTITAAMVVPLAYYLGHNVETYVELVPNNTDSDTSNFTLTESFMGQALTIPFTGGFSPASGTQTVSVDLTAGINVTNIASGSSAGQGFRIIFQRQPTKQIHVVGQVNAFEEAYPGTLSYEWIPPSTGAATPFNLGDTISLDNYSCTVQGATEFGVLWPTLVGTQPPTLAQGDGIEPRITAASLIANNETGGQTVPLCARLAPFNACTIYQAPNFIVDACTSTANWKSGSSTDANVSIIGGYIQVNSAVAPYAGGAAGNAPVTAYPNLFSFQGYSHLEVDITPATSSGGAIQLQAFEASAGGLTPFTYSETMGAAGVMTTVRFNLMAPATGPFGTLFQSRIIDSPATPYGAPPITNVGPGWGLDNVQTFNLQFPGSSGLYKISQIRLVRDTAPRVSFLWSNASLYELYYGTSVPYAKYALSDTDGKRSFGVGDYQIGVTNPTMISAGAGSFSAIVNAISGWTVTPNVSSTDMNAWYFSWYLSHLCGAGCIYTGTAPSTYWLDQPITTNPTQLQVQAKATYVLVTPQCGDLTNNGTFGGPFAYYTFEFIRQRVTGVAIDENQAPLVGNTVTELAQPSGSSSGSGTTNSAGRFLTGDNYAQTALAQKSVLSGVSTATGTIVTPPQIADILRVGYIGNPGGGQVDILQTFDGELMTVYVVNGNVYFSRSYETEPNFAYTTKVTQDGNWSWPAICRLANGRLELRATQTISGAASTYRMWSDDAGKTWQPVSGGSLSPELVLASSTLTKIRCDSDGNAMEITFVPDSGTTGPGTFSIRVKRSGDSAFGTAFVPLNNSGTNLRSDGSGFGHDKGAEGANRWFLGMVADGETAQSVWWSGNLGESWKKF